MNRLIFSDIIFRFTLDRTQSYEMRSSFECFPGPFPFPLTNTTAAHLLSFRQSYCPPPPEDCPQTVYYFLITWFEISYRFVWKSLPFFDDEPIIKLLSSPSRNGCYEWKARHIFGAIRKPFSYSSPPDPKGRPHLPLFIVPVSDYRHQLALVSI